MCVCVKCYHCQQSVRQNRHGGYSAGMRFYSSDHVSVEDYFIEGRGAAHILRAEGFRLVTKHPWGGCVALGPVEDGSLL